MGTAEYFFICQACKFFTPSILGHERESHPTDDYRVRHTKDEYWQ